MRGSRRERCHGAHKPGARGYHSTSHENMNRTYPLNNSVRDWATNVSCLGCVTSDAVWTPVRTIVLWLGSATEIPQYPALCISAFAEYVYDQRGTPKWRSHPASQVQPAFRKNGCVCERFSRPRGVYFTAQKL